jgi:hypothetical protein
VPLHLRLQKVRGFRLWHKTRERVVSISESEENNAACMSGSRQGEEGFGVHLQMRIVRAAERNRRRGQDAARRVGV